MQPDSAISVDGIEVSFGAVRALQGVSMHVRQGEITCVVGNNGAGKSTLLRAILGMVPLAAGSVRYLGDDVTARRPSWRVHEGGVALVPEGRAILAGMSVRENLLLGEDVGTLRRGPEQVQETRAKVLAMFPVLSERLGLLAGNLSGGEQQMLAIGRALVMEPDVLLLDEPSMGIAPLLVQEIFRGLHTYVSEQNLTVLLIEQNTKLALELSSYGYVLDRGVVELEGSTKELSQDSRLAEAYLGIES